MTLRNRLRPTSCWGLTDASYTDAHSHEDDELMINHVRVVSYRHGVLVVAQDEDGEKLLQGDGSWRRYDGFTMPEDTDVLPVKWV